MNFSYFIDVSFLPVLLFVNYGFTDPLFMFTQRPDPIGSDEGAKHMDAIQAVIQQGKLNYLD